MKRMLVMITTLLMLGIVASVTTADMHDLKQEAIETYANIVYASYQDSLDLAISLNEALAAFVVAPDDDSLAAARAAWLAANEPYGQTEAYRFYGGPIDDEDGPEGLLNAWPLDEAYVDYVEGDADAGIINNSADYPEISKDLLISLNEVGAEENISTGYHAIEFLLWGTRSLRGQRWATPRQRLRQRRQCRAPRAISAHHRRAAGRELAGHGRAVAAGRRR